MQSALAAAVAPQFAPMRVLAGEAAPSKRIRLGHIGVGGQGSSLLRNFLAVDIALSAAVCDPFRARREAAAGMVKQSQGHDPVRVNDFRELLADRSIDAVVIATPDHWHVPIAVAALNAGKDVYVEKPLGHNVAEGRAMVDAARKHNRVVQTGTQQRSAAHFHRIREIIASGSLGPVKFVRIWNYSNLTPDGIGRAADGPPPAGLDWDFYLGPAPHRPFNPKRFLGTYRYFWDYAGGVPTDWGTHRFDVLHLAMGQSVPTTVAASGGRFLLDDAGEVFLAIREKGKWVYHSREDLGIPRGQVIEKPRVERERASVNVK